MNQLGGKLKRTVGTRAQVSRGSAEKTSGGLGMNSGLQRNKWGNIVSVKVSKQSKAKYHRTGKYAAPKYDALNRLKDKRDEIEEAFDWVTSAREDKGPGWKINSRAVFKDPLGAQEDPEKYLYRG